MMKRRLISIFIGGLTGYLYYYFVGCRTGACAITSNPLISTVYGAVLSGLIVELIHDIMIPKSQKESLFDAIAPVYALFYSMQKKRFKEVLDGTGEVFDMASFKTVLDVGCGTGALCSTLAQRGFSVTGIDPAEKMLEIAIKKTEGDQITFIHSKAAEHLPFEDKTFDISIASYVAHGISKEQRKKLYEQMSRVTKSKIIIYDYNRNKSLLTTIIEWLEKGDYFYFIENAEAEMKDCFSDVKVIPVSSRASWYICTPGGIKHENHKTIKG